MYLLKQLPSDFIVREIPKIKIAESGRYLYLKITKKNKNTLDVVKQLAKLFHLPEKDIGFAGNKDKNAITEQVFSVKGGSKERVSSPEIPDLKIECLGFGTSPVTLGDLEGNEFEITIRNLEKEKIKTIQYIPNYFDEQRFASNNATIGKHLIKKEFAQALELMKYSQCTHHIETHKNDFEINTNKVIEDVCQRLSELSVERNSGAISARSSRSTERREIFPRNFRVHSKS